MNKIIKFNEIHIKQIAGLSQDENKELDVLYYTIKDLASSFDKTIEKFKNTDAINIIDKKTFEIALNNYDKNDLKIFNSTIQSQARKAKKLGAEILEVTRF